MTISTSRRHSANAALPFKEQKFWHTSVINLINLIWADVWSVERVLADSQTLEADELPDQTLEADSGVN
jgi:hypothetical protein